MAGETNFIRFHILVLRFVFSIFLLILSPNLVLILVGWDGLGVSSYLLVIYYLREKSFNSGLLTAITNRLGDGLILIALGIARGLVTGIRSLSISDRHVGGLMWLIVIAATTKRAQVPFSAWLPAAMAAPTPVSSLVHSSTLVTAGVYLLIRFSANLGRGGLYLLLAGLFTIFLASVRALGEVDLKKIIALSTLRQLGVMVNCLGGGWSDLAFSHLVVHAFFKALIFICVGNIIHGLASEQDFRKRGLSFLSMPLRGGVIILRIIRLAGLPFLGAFFSKDLIIERICIRKINFGCLFLVLISLPLTPAYMIRFILLIFVYRGTKGPSILLLVEGGRTKKGIVTLFIICFLSGWWRIMVRAGARKVFVLPGELKALVLLRVTGGVVISLLLRFNFMKSKEKWGRGRMWGLRWGVRRIARSFLFWCNPLFFKRVEWGIRNYIPHKSLGAARGLAATIGISKSKEILIVFFIFLIVFLLI